MGDLRSNLLRFSGGLILSGLVLWFLLSHIDRAEFEKSWGRISLWGAFAAIGIHGFSLVLRVWRWRDLLDASECGPPPGSPKALIWDSAFFGWLVNLTLPARAGELARPLMFARGSGRPFARVLGTSVVERAADLATVALLGFLALTVLPGVELLPSWLPQTVGIGAGVALASLLLALALARQASNRTESGSRLFDAANRLREGFSSLRQPRTLVRLTLWSLGIWLLEALSVWVVLWSCGQPAPVNLAFVHTIAVTMSVSLITVPFGIGVEQTTTVGLFSLWKISRPDALAMSIVLTFSALVWVVPGGLWAWWRQGARRGRPPEAN